MSTECPDCAGNLRISALTCEDCELSLHGDLPTPRLYRLSTEDQRFVELFISASGSLKQTASLLQVSYPTVRSRLDRVIERLEALRRDDEVRKAKVLEDIDSGRLSAKRGTRMIANFQR